MAVVKVSVNTTLPIAKAGWKVDVGEDPVLALKYSNLAYDLVAVAMAKLGVAMSQAVVGEGAELEKLYKDVGNRGK